MHPSCQIGESCPFAAGPGVAPISASQRQRATELGWGFTSLDADLSPKRQAEHLTRLVDLGVDAFTSWTLAPELAEPGYARAVSAGIPVVTFNSDTPSAVTVIRQQADSALPADDAAAFIAERLPGARVLVVGGPPIPALAARTTHFLTAAGTSGLRVVAREDNVGDVAETALPIVERLLDLHPDAQAIWCFNDYTALAAADVLRRRRIRAWSDAGAGVVVSGIGGIPAAIAAVRGGAMTLTYDSLPVEAGRGAIDVLEGLLVRGEAPPPEVLIGCARYDASNVATFVPWHER